MVKPKKAAPKHSKSAVPEWLAESMRVTGFPLPGDVFDVTRIWESVTGKKPKEVSELPERQIMREIGSFGEGQLIINQQPDRVDMIFQPRPKVPVQIEKLPADKLVSIDRPLVAIGKFADAQSEFVQVVSEWLPDISPLRRLAFATTIASEADDLSEAQSMLLPLLRGIQLDPSSDFSDLVWQINRPRPCQSVESLKINRLMKWSTPELSILEVAVDSASRAASPRTVAKVRTVRAELDINTAADRIEALPKAKLQALFEELVGFAEEITKEGDIP